MREIVPSLKLAIDYAQVFNPYQISNTKRGAFTVLVCRNYREGNTSLVQRKGNIFFSRDMRHVTLYG